MGESAHDPAVPWSRRTAIVHGQCRIFRYSGRTECSQSPMGCSRRVEIGESGDTGTYSSQLRGSDRGKGASAAKRRGEEFFCSHLALFLIPGLSTEYVLFIFNLFYFYLPVYRNRDQVEEQREEKLQTKEEEIYDIVIR